MSNSQPDLTKTSALSPVGALGKPGKRGHRREGSTGDRLHSFFQKTVTTPVNSLIGTNSSDRRNSMKASTSDERTRSDWGPGVTAYGADYTDYRRKLMNIKNAKGELQQDMVVDLEQLMLQQEEVDDKHDDNVSQDRIFSELNRVSSKKSSLRTVRRISDERNLSNLNVDTEDCDAILQAIDQSSEATGETTEATLTTNDTNEDPARTHSKAGWISIGNNKGTKALAERWCELEFAELRIFTDDTREHISNMLVLTGCSTTLVNGKTNFRLSSPNYQPITIMCETATEAEEWMLIISFWAELSTISHSTASQVLTELLDEFVHTWKHKFMFQQTKSLEWLRDRLVMYSVWLCDVLSIQYNEDEIIEQMCMRDFDQLLRKSLSLAANTKWVIRPVVLNHLAYYLMLAETHSSENIGTEMNLSLIPKLNIVLVTVGSRGDVQPFIVLAQRFKEMGHQVRIATHEFHREFVERHKIDFYMIPGDPKLLMAFMEGVNLMSTEFWGKTLPGHRAWIKALLRGIYDACNEPWDGVAEIRPTHWADGNRMPLRYRADLIIANPPSFAAPHVAEAMNIPLCMAFTMPWTPTRNVPSPFIVVNSDGPSFINYSTYTAVDRALWLGTRDMINTFRTQYLGINKLPYGTGYKILQARRTPFCYCFSTHLLPRPNDWGPWIDVVGFWFYDSKTKSDYEPEPKLKKFLAENKKPVFIGFGSIVVNDPDRLTRTILEAARLLGKPVIIQQGWADISGDSEIPDNVLMIGPCPHDWLFNGRVAAVVHHGGAGTMSTGLMFGNPTVIVPFILDQFFWGLVVAEMGVGPTACPWSSLTGEKLCKAMQYALTDPVKKKAMDLGKKLREEGGDTKGASAILRRLPVPKMRDMLLPERLANVWCDACKLRLSYASDKILHLSERGAKEGMSIHARYQLKYIDHVDNSNPDPRGKKLDEEDDAYIQSNEIEVTDDDIDDVWEAMDCLLHRLQESG